jgi:hypothetical protein
MACHDGHRVSQTTALRRLRDEGLILPAQYQRERRKLAERRKAAFAKEPTGPNQVWQLDFSEYETTAGGTWRIAACRDYWSKYEFDAHVSPTANFLPSRHEDGEGVEADQRPVGAVAQWRSAATESASSERRSRSSRSTLRSQAGAGRRRTFRPEAVGSTPEFVPRGRLMVGMSNNGPDDV